MKVYGYELEIKKIQKLINENSMPIILSGEAHNGKTFIAKYLIKGSFCESGTTFPCNECKSCRRFDHGNEIDFLYIEDVENKNILTLSEVEKIQDFCLSKPIQNPYKVILIKDIHKFNTVSQNALLKTLEEPPSFVKFVFTSSSVHYVLETIRSRSVIFPIYTISKQSISEYMDDNFKELEADKKNSVLNIANSIYLVNLFLSPTEGQKTFAELRDEVLEYLQNMSEKNLYHSFDLSNVFSKNIDNFNVMYLILKSLLMDMLYKKMNVDIYIINSDKEDYIIPLSDKTDTNKLIVMIEELIKYKGYFQMNFKKDLIINNMVIGLFKCFNIIRSHS